MRVYKVAQTEKKMPLHKICAVEMNETHVMSTVTCTHDGYATV